MPPWISSLPTGTAPTMTTEACRRMSSRGGGSARNASRPTTRGNRMLLETKDGPQRLTLMMETCETAHEWQGHKHPVVDEWHMVKVTDRKER
mmetsp:Transcript_5101/g.18320  ORF Transcript_5101/g.18320 Transcript_5101/m.18320 type:complete len:92 (-) Transcript_5101:108-383(-)